MPGVDAAPREAELLANARRARRERRFARGTSAPVPVEPLPESADPRGVSFACGIGLGLGVIAALWVYAV